MAICPYFFCYAINPYKPGGFCATGEKCNCDCDFQRRFEIPYLQSLLIPDLNYKLDSIKEKYCYFCVLSDMHSEFDNLSRPERCQKLTEYLLDKREKGEL